MDSALVLITLASLGTTGAVLLYAARLIRDERTRSNARVTALAEEIGHIPADAGRQPPPHAYAAPAANIPLGRDQREPVRERTSVPAARTPVPAARTPVGMAPEPRRAGDGRDPSAVAAPLPSRVPPTRDAGALRGHGAGGAALFQSASTESAASNRMLVPIIGAVIVALALATIYFVSGQPEATTGPARAAAGAPNVPLELVSLRQAREGETLTVSGTVRNPSGAADRRQVAAVVFVFDRKGSFVASGRAPIDYQALAPGDESPFVITVPGAADVSRYRVSFREGDDVLPHVDRREATPLAGQPAATR
jgi:hypothetical protein